MTPVPATGTGTGTGASTDTGLGVRVVRVVRREQVSPSFVRIVLGPDVAGDPLPVARLGADQWFRLFVPAGGDPAGDLELPWGPADGWYQRWLDLDESTRAVVRNYTVRALRESASGEWELDVDFVLHRGEGGTLEGIAASWAASVEPGHRVGLLGQGTIFDAPDGVDRLLAVCDETGLPGLEAALRDLPDGVAVDVVAEVPCADDVRDLPGAARCVWAFREQGRTWEDGLAEVGSGHGAVYAVGGTDLALGNRRRARSRGLADDRIAFCSYWRRGHR